MMNDDNNNNDSFAIQMGSHVAEPDTFAYTLLY